MMRTAAPNTTISPYSRIAFATRFGFALSVACCGSLDCSPCCPSTHSAVPDVLQRGERCNEGRAAWRTILSASDVASGCSAKDLPSSSSSSGVDDFHMNSRILNHIETSSNIAGMQHAAARSVAVLNVSLSGAGMI
jgi:hypothetical protein